LNKIEKASPLGRICPLEIVLKAAKGGAVIARPVLKLGIGGVIQNGRIIGVAIEATRIEAAGVGNRVERSFERRKTSSARVAARGGPGVGEDVFIALIRHASADRRIFKGGDHAL